MTDQFKADVLAGLSATPKHLSSKYFYDEIGDKLFQRIMAMPEYYLTDCEMEIFSEQTAGIIDAFGFDRDREFDIIELGAGDGSKTIHLLSYLINQDRQFNYLPVDISANALSTIKKELLTALPNLSIDTMQGEYFSVLERRMNTSNPKVVLQISCYPHITMQLGLRRHSTLMYSPASIMNWVLILISHSMHTSLIMMSLPVILGAIF